MTRPLTICAHRGASRTHPENTRAAFDEALRVGADMLEFDIRRTRDGQCVVMHDATVDRTTNGHGEVANLMYETIRNLDAGGGERVPNLDEVMAYADRAMLNVQIKALYDTDGIAIADALVEYFQDAAVCRSAFVTAHNVPLMRRLREQVPHVRLCNLAKRHDPISAATEEPIAQVLQPAVAHVTAEMVAAAHEHGMKVNVYFADDVDTAQRLMDMRVDGILTNDPALLVEHFRAR